MILKRITFLLLITFLFYSCNKSIEKNSAKQVNNSSIQELTDYDQKLQKVNAIEKSFNKYSTRAFEVYNDYISSFGNNIDKIELIEIANFSQIDDSQVQSLNLLDSVIEMPVLKELDPLIRSYKINGRAFAVTINSCKSYYTKKEYKKDKYDKGGVLHKLAIEIYSKFRRADSLLRDKNVKISQQLESEYLNTLKKGGFEVEYLVQISKKNAEDINSILLSTTYDDLKVEKLYSLHSQIETIYVRLRELKQSSLKQFNPESIVYYSKFEQFHNTINNLIQHKKEKKKFSKSDRKKLKENKHAANSVIGSTQAVTFSYKNLTISFNELKPERLYKLPKIANIKAAIASSIKIPNAIK